MSLYEKYGLSVGQHIWLVGTVGYVADNRIFEHIVTGDTWIDNSGQDRFLAKGIDGCDIWFRFNDVGHGIYFTEDKAKKVLDRLLNEYKKTN